MHELACGCPRAERREMELLRTPVANEVEGGAVSPEVAKAKGQTLRLSGQMIDMVAPDQLPKLPTPISSDWKNGKSSSGFGLNLSETSKLLPTTRANEPGSTSPGYGDSLNDIANRVVNGHARKDLLHTPDATPDAGNSRIQNRTGPQGLGKQAKYIAGNLLPTTRTSMANGPTQREIEAGNPKSRLETVTNWGKYEPAIKRWEQVIGRKAPAPTKPDGKDGNHRLSSVFTEWMMGLPEGWITDVGLRRNEELKACGNGVVPQQAELALRILLDGLAIESTGGGK